MPAPDPGGFLRVLRQRLLTDAIQGLDHTVVDDRLGL